MVLNLGQIIILETLWKNETKKDNLSTDEINHYLVEEKGLHKQDIDYVRHLHQWAKNTFTDDQQNEFNQLMESCEEMRQVMANDGVEQAMGLLGHILWNTGNLFGTNYINHEELN